ncbi:MAG TPA: alpha/beta hydrolase [Alphaproteobacteria bacterium]|nr:alpha/beta hydrolase [Alphaproteobacteria bacterium]
MDFPPDFQYSTLEGEPPLAYRQDGKGIAQPGLFFLPGFFSNMTGTKASFLAEKAALSGRMLTRLDYRGHGFSQGRFDEGCISDWLEDALAIFDKVTEGPQILVGSSMGGWIMLLLALARPKRVAGLVGLAAAPDFTEDLVWKNLPPARQKEMLQKGVIYETSEYDDSSVPYTLKLIEDGRKHMLLNKPIPVNCPVRLIQGMEDKDVPWGWALRIAEKLQSPDVRVTLLKNSDHRLSAPADLELIWQQIEGLCV